MAGQTVERQLDSRVKIAWLLPVYAFALILLLLALVAWLLMPTNARSTIVPTASNGETILAILILAELLVLLPSHLWMQIKYMAFTYSFGTNELIIRDGIVTRQRIVVPYERIQRVSTERTLRDRMLSLATLRIETAARDALQFSATLPGIAYVQRDALIAEIMGHVMRRRSGSGLEAHKDNDLENVGEVLQELRGIHDLLERQGRHGRDDERLRRTLRKFKGVHNYIKQLVKKPQQEAGAGNGKRMREAGGSGEAKGRSGESGTGAPEAGREDPSGAAGSAEKLPELSEFGGLKEDIMRPGKRRSKKGRGRKKKRQR